MTSRVIGDKKAIKWIKINLGWLESIARRRDYTIIIVYHLQGLMQARGTYFSRRRTSAGSNLHLLPLPSLDISFVVNRRRQFTHRFPCHGHVNLVRFILWPPRGGGSCNHMK